jgi:hypothetical protein
MRLTSGVVVGGKVVLDDAQLPEGTRVTVVAPGDDEAFPLSATASATLAERLEDADRGDVVDGEALLRELDQPR